MLEITDLVVKYGQIKGVGKLSLSLEKDSALALLGANGSGKTTTINTIAGLLRPSSGKIIFEGEDITNLSAKERAKRGIATVLEGRHLFSDMSVYENLLMGGFLHSNNPRKIEEMFNRFGVLRKKKKMLAGALSGGEQQILAIMRALMLKPKLMILDEPTMGLSPKMATEVFSQLREIRESGVNMIISGQEIYKTLELCPKCLVLKIGETSFYGSSKELIKRGQLQNIYMGI